MLLYELLPFPVAVLGDVGNAVFNVVEHDGQLDLKMLKQGVMGLKIFLDGGSDLHGITVGFNRPQRLERGYLGLGQPGHAGDIHPLIRPVAA